MKPEMKKLIIANLPYLLFVYLFGKLGQAYRLAKGIDLSQKLLHFADGCAAAFESAAPSFHPTDLLIGVAGAAALRLMVYCKGKNAKKYRKGVEYGSARWGGPKDIAPYTDPNFDNNILLTQTERLTMNNRPKDPKTARNKNVLVIGGSGSGKTRFFVKPNLMQCVSKDYPTSFVITDPKGSLIGEVGQLLIRSGYRVKVLNTINFSKSMKYNPFRYLHSEKDVLKLVIHTSPCTGKWRGTSDMTIRFDNGASLFIGNHLTPKAKTVKVQTECVNRTLVQYNPEIVKATKEAALPALLQREAKDNEIAAQKGLKPYTLLNVEFNEGADEKTGGYIGWYYVTLAVDGKIYTHLETGLNHDIASGKVSDTPTWADYYPAGALKEGDVDYVFNNVGFSSDSSLYTVPLRDDVRERAEKTLAERSAAAPEASREWGFYIIPDLKTWATNAEQQTPIEHFATFEEAKARFDELRSQPYNSEAKDLNTDGRPYAHLTLGMESKDGMSAADILHVRAGQNYLVEDFTRMERLRSDPVVLKSLSRVAQEIGFDRVRPYVMENGSYKAMPDMPFTQWENPYFTVDPPAQEQGDTFTIYQLKGGPETRDYRFEAYERLQEAGLAVDRQNYDLVYTAPLDGKTTLEDIYRTFNLDRPADFTGHSLSVSDVVVLTRSGKEEAHYCDSFGFTPVPEFFLQREKQLTPRELLTGESIQTPRGSFLVTDMSREQLEAAGYGFHHQSEDGKYLIMGNGTDAFAIPAQQESPIKAAEMTTEQNYNMIDGVLNNAPTMSELEAKAKAGEQISLFDVAEAAKAEAQKPKQPQRPAQKQKKPSIRAQLKAAKEEQQKKPPQREKAQELEV